MRILYVTTIGSTMIFFKPLIKMLIDEGHVVDIATNEHAGKVPECYRKWGCNIYSIMCSRSPLNVRNVIAIKQISAVMRENHYDIVHCHTPIASVCTRLACRKFRKAGGKIFYTAHGFHFYNGAPIKNWLVYYTIEKICAHFTDVLITINTEDYKLAQKKLKVKQIRYIPGVGVDTNKFSPVECDASEGKRTIGINNNDSILMLSVGELNSNKNHSIVIEALAQINNNNLHYAIAGEGALYSNLKNLAEGLGVNERVHLLGFRNDVSKLYDMADIFVFPSYREGLPVSLMEAMSKGKLCIVSSIRGNVDLINEERGYLFNPSDVNMLIKCIEKCINNEKKNLVLKENCRLFIQEFGIDKVNNEIRNIYEEYAD